MKNAMLNCIFLDYLFTNEKSCVMIEKRKGERKW